MDSNCKKTNKKRIIIIDDEPLVLEVVKEVLSEKYDVLTVTTPQELLTQIGVYFPDLILMDVKLPDMDGDELLAHIRSMGSRVPIILFSATYDVGNIKAVGHWVDILQGQAVLTKPFDIDVLEETVDAVIKQGPVANLDN